MDAADTNLDRHRQSSIAQEVRFPCGGPQGTAMSLTADENMSWLHGTYLDFQSCQYALLLTSLRAISLNAYCNMSWAHAH